MFNILLYVTVLVSVVLTHSVHTTIASLLRLPCYVKLMDELLNWRYICCQ